MSWKSVVWAGCALPVLAGCGSMRPFAGQSAPGDAVTVGHASRPDAHAAWQAVCDRHRQPFTEEFHDGFTDGYSGYLERGVAAEAPAVPPAPYERYKKYLAPEGQSLVRDYYLGYQYGIDVAVASGRKSAPAVSMVGAVIPPKVPTVPPRTNPPWSPPAVAAVPDVPLQAMTAPVGNKFGGPITTRTDDEPSPSSGEPPPPAPAVEGGGVTPIPVPPSKVELPNPDVPRGKFSPIPVPPNPDLLPIPNPPIPVPGSRIEPLPIPEGPLTAPAPSMKVPLGESESALPLILREAPVIPFRHPPPGK